MKFYPTKELQFKLHDSQEDTLSRLNRRTEKSENLTSQYTDKTFRGSIGGNKFKVISSVVGKGAFCVMIGEINAENGHVKIRINKAFKVLLSIILCFPIVGFIVLTFFKVEEFSIVFILVALGQILMIRYIFIEIAFRVLSKASLNRLRDVLDFEWI